MTTPLATPPIDLLRASTRRRVLWRIMPFLMVCYFVNYLDRSNLGFAGPNGLNEALDLTATAFGFASGIFFIGYILLEVPSNLALHKFGARKWIARIMLSWGVVASLTAFVQDATMLYVLRFLLGVAEAGFTPGILLYLTYWFVQKDRAQAYALFLIGIPLSSTIGAPLASGLIEWGDNLLFGLEGWRFMILVTGIPAVLLGIMCFFYLTDRPEQAKWLRDDQRAQLILDLKSEESTYQKHSLRDVFRNKRVWLLGLGYFGLVFGLYAISFFLPTIIQGFQQTFGVEYGIFETGLLTAVPYGFAVIFTVLWSMHSRRTNEIALHVSVSAVMGAVGILVAIWADSPFVTLVGITVAAMGICSGIPLSFGLPTTFLSGVGAAAGLALINTIGNLGGFGGPFIFGWLRDATGATSTGLYVIAALCLLSAVLAFFVRRWITTTAVAATETAQPVGSDTK